MTEPRSFDLLLTASRAWQWPGACRSIKELAQRKPRREADRAPHPSRGNNDPPSMPRTSRPRFQSRVNQQLAKLLLLQQQSRPTGQEALYPKGPFLHVAISTSTVKETKFSSEHSGTFGQIKSLVLQILTVRPPRLPARFYFLIFGLS